MKDQEPALINGLFLCDSLIREHGTGKLSLIGCFTQFAFPHLPFRVGRFFAVACITNVRAPFEKAAAVCRLEVAETGHVIASAACEFGMAQGFQPFPDLVFELPFVFAGVQFQSGGRYQFVVLVDNEIVGRRFMMVSQITSQALPPPA